MLATPQEFLNLVRRAHAGDNTARLEATGIVNDVLRRSSDGDASVLPFVKAWLDAMPDHAIRVLKGDPAKWAEDALVGRIASGNPALREAVSRRMAQVRDDLAGGEPSPLETLLAARVAFCWAEAYELDWHDIAAEGTERTFNEIRLWQMKRDRAHRRLLTSVQALAAVRRLPAPPVRVNVGTENVEAPPEERQSGLDVMQLLWERATARN